MEFNGITLLFLIGMVFLCVFIFWVYLDTVYGYSSEIITPINTGNQIYCGFGERDNCMNIIPQNQPIPLSQIQNMVS